MQRQVVRTVLMRATLHLVTADDCLLLRPLMQPVLDRELARHRDYGPALAAIDLGPVLAHAGALLAERPRTGGELRAALAERFPEHDATALGYACRNFLALVQVPPRGVWGRTGQVTSTTAESWLGRPLAADAFPRPRRAALRQGLRPGDGCRRGGLVAPDRAAGRDRAAPTPAACLPGRARTRALRPPRRAQA